MEEAQRKIRNEEYTNVTEIEEEICEFNVRFKDGLMSQEKANDFLWVCHQSHTNAWEK